MPTGSRVVPNTPADATPTAKRATEPETPGEEHPDDPHRAQLIVGRGNAPGLRGRLAGPMQEAPRSTPGEVEAEAEGALERQSLLGFFRDRDHTQGNLLVSVLVLALPSVFTTAFSFGVFQVLELSFLGRLGEHALAAAGSSDQILRQGLMMLAMGMSVASQMMIARFVGAGRVDGAEHVAGQSYVLAAGLALFAALTGGLFPETLVRARRVRPGGHRARDRLRADRVPDLLRADLGPDLREHPERRGRHHDADADLVHRHPDLDLLRVVAHLRPRGLPRAGHRGHPAGLGDRRRPAAPASRSSCCSAGAAACTCGCATSCPTRGVAADLVERRVAAARSTCSRAR